MVFVPAVRQGDAVRWAIRDRVTNAISRVVASRATRDSFVVVTSAGADNECVTLDCHRLAPVSELLFGDSDESAGEKSTSPRRRKDIRSDHDERSAEVPAVSTVATATEVSAVSGTVFPDTEVAWPAVSCDALSGGAAEENKAPCESVFVSVSISAIDPAIWVSDWSNSRSGLITAWVAGRRCRGREIQNPWRKDTSFWVAWQQGFEGNDLFIDPDSQSAASRNASGSEASLPVPVQDDRVESGGSIVDEAAPVCVMAIDFMNLFVRAWHAGARSKIHGARGRLQTVAYAIQRLKPQKIVLALEGGHDHRTALSPQYKAHRPPHDPDLLAQRDLAISAISSCGLPAISVNGYEADDVLASIARQNPGTVILSSDKDLLSLCGIARIWHPWGTGSYVTAEQKLSVKADQVTDYLSMVGDAADGIQGVTGVGPKTAVMLLQQFGNLDRILLAAAEGKIAGSVCRKMHDGREQAILARELVVMRDDLGIGEIPDWEPRGAWLQKMQSMNLGGVAFQLSKVFAERTGVAPSTGGAERSAVSASRPASRSLFD